MTRASVTAVVARVRDQGGVVRSAELVRQGLSTHVIASAVASGMLIRVRRTWVAVPDADAYLLAAAREGVVLSCVTEASRRELWVLDLDRPHVAAHPHAGRVHLDGARVHRAKPLVPRHPGALVDPIENVLASVAVCQPYEPALAVWESALRKGLVDPLALARLPLSARARGILADARPHSDSGLETIFVPRLRWLQVGIVPQVWIAGHRVDFLIGERLVVQIDGGHHVGAQRESDVRHDAQLLLLGYHVICVGYHQVVHDWPAVQDVIVRAVAQGLHRAR